MEQAVDFLSTFVTDHIMVWVLLAAAIYFTVRTRGVQFRMLGQMLRQLVARGEKSGTKSVSSFQAFALSIASRVGTGNLAGVATAIALGGPGAVFWMWVIAMLGAATSFVESTLAQLFKVRGAAGSFRGGPAYYILAGLGSRAWAVTFAVLITLTFGFAFNTVQSKTIAAAFGECFGFDARVTGGVLAVATLVIIFGGIHRISRFSAIVVPVMAVAYLILGLVIIVLNIQRLPEVLLMIVENAFGVGQVFGGGIGICMIMGIKRGLFSNEAGEGSTPCAAATADVSHPVKQGLVQALGVYTDTLLVCSATAFIILCSGFHTAGYDGIILTQRAIDAGLGSSGGYGSFFVAIAILFFAFTSIVANYYYGESNIRFICNNENLIRAYRLAVGLMVYLGAVMSLHLVWGFADITMALMTLCNLAAILLLGGYAVRLLDDYTHQLRNGRDPVFRGSAFPELKGKISCWQ